MSLLIGFLTVVLWVDCIALVFLVLLQLPKKEAGAGVAFGGGTTEALFGAGSGTVLSNVTKYMAAIFFALAFLLAILQTHRSRESGSGLLEELQKKDASAVTAPAAAPVLVHTNADAVIPNMPSLNKPLTLPAATNAAASTQAEAQPAPVVPAPATNAAGAKK